MSSAITSRIHDLLEESPPFNMLPERTRKEILADISIEYFKEGEVLIEQGSTAHKGLYIVESGVVRLMDVEKQRLIDKCSEGDVVGSFGLLKGGAAIYEAKAVEPTVCVFLKGERFRQLVTTYPEFNEYFENDVKQFVRHIDREMDVAGAHLLFNRRLNQFEHRQPVTCPIDATVQQAARIMRRESVDSILVMQDGKVAGIVADSDLRNKLIARGLSVDTPVRRIMASPVVTISSGASLFEAMMMMLNRHVNRLVVVRENSDGNEEPLSVLTDRDAAHFRGQDPVATVRRIANATDVSELVSIRSATHEQLLRLYRQGVQPEMLNGIMSVVYDGLVRRVVELVERDLRSRHADMRVDLPWVWLRLGSGGRQEMALNSQQHNALMYANPRSQEEALKAELWFDKIAGRVNEGMALCGFTMSPIVARDLRWRKPLREWKKTYREWILQSDGGELADAGLFFDLRPIYGPEAMVTELKLDLIDALNVQEMDPSRNFLALMSRHALEKTPPLSLFRRFVLQRSGEHRNTFDLRDRGVLPVVNAVRLLAIELRYFESTNTFDRLRYAADALPELSKVLLSAIEAYRHLVDYRLEDQLRAFESGETPKNHIDPFTLRKVQQNLLRNVFSVVAELQDAMTKRYATSRARSKDAAARD